MNGRGPTDRSETPIDDGGGDTTGDDGGGDSGSSANMVGFGNIVANAETSTVSIDVLLPPQAGNLTGLHLDLTGNAQDGVSQVIGLNGATVDAFTSDGGHVVVDPGDLHTNGWNADGGPDCYIRVCKFSSSYPYESMRVLR